MKMRPNWNPAKFIPKLSGVEVLEGYNYRGIRFDKRVFDQDIVASLVIVDIIIIEMMEFKR